MSNEVTLGRQASGVRRETKEVTRSSAEERTPSVRKRVNSKEKYAVLKAVAASLIAHSFPPMDERLKNIVASQVGHLLAGGYLLEDIKYAAVELGLSWDQKRGHNRLTHLASRVRAEFWADEQKADKIRSGGAIDPAVAALMPDKSMPDSRRQHPNNHPFEWDSSTSCRICGGPPGVHVRRVEEVS